MSYVRYQRDNAMAWLALLPLAMGSPSGFFTILWAPGNITVKLVDSFGDDDIDILV